MKHQLDTQTDEENQGRADDATDALEIACWLATTSRGSEPAREDLTTQQILERMDADGTPVVRRTVPVEDWPVSWVDQVVGVKREPMMAGMDPYAGM